MWSVSYSGFVYSYRMHTCSHVGKSLYSKPLLVLGPIVLTSWAVCIRSVIASGGRFSTEEPNSTSEICLAFHEEHILQVTCRLWSVVPMCLIFNHLNIYPSDPGIPTWYWVRIPDQNRNYQFRLMVGTRRCKAKGIDLTPDWPHWQAPLRSKAHTHKVH